MLMVHQNQYAVYRSCTLVPRSRQCEGHLKQYELGKKLHTIHVPIAREYIETAYEIVTKVYLDHNTITKKFTKMLVKIERISTKMPFFTPRSLQKKY